MHYLAVRIAELLGRNSDHHFNNDEVRYGLEVFLGAILQIIIILALAYGLGIGNEVLAIIVSACVLRGYSGGGHCQAYYRCTIFSIMVFITLGFLVQYIKPVYFQVYFMFVILFALVTIVKKAPVDNPGNPITDINKCQKLKKQSLIVVLILLLLSVTAKYFSYSVIAISLLTGVLWQVFTLTSWGDIFISLWDQILSFFENSFQRKEGY